MTAPIHTYGAKCLLADDDPDLSAWHSSPSPPKVRTQFFYTSSLPIDDPLSPLPPPSGGQSAGNERAPPQPFSARDNMALENAWKQLQITWENSTGQQKPQEGTSIPARNTQISVSKRIPNLERKRQTGSRENISSVDSHESSPHVSTPILDDQLSNVSKTRPNREVGSVDVRSKGSWEGMRVRSMQENDARDINQKYTSSYRKRAGSSIGFDPKTVGRKTSSSSPYDDTASLEEMESGSLHGNPSRDVSISGSPFIRAPLSQPQTPLGRSVETSSLRDVDEEPHAEPQSRGSAHIVPKPSGLRTSVRWEGSPEEPSLDTDGESEEQRSQLLVPVGVSRLHLVELPNLKV
ncbi:DDHD domain-containing protein [Aspergillus sclerotialis]|uniref:DDHD domain-containing protein n=1 Tax=Aspergillus sclerotialis TaxID=2070753 RepID=A0A3A2ZY85_9EURO|nr:DDHD domain-containing protein [Aspergillus sclerotialis]